MIDSDYAMYGGFNYDEHVFINFLRELYTLHILRGFTIDSLAMVNRVGRVKYYVPQE